MLSRNRSLAEALIKCEQIAAMLTGSMLRRMRSIRRVAAVKGAIRIVVLVIPHLDRFPGCKAR